MALDNENVLKERAAIIRRMMFKRDWGRCPNKQICEDCSGRKIEKMGEPVQVYTACHFVSP